MGWNHEALSAGAGPIFASRLSMVQKSNGRMKQTVESWDPAHEARTWPAVNIAARQQQRAAAGPSPGAIAGWPGRSHVQLISDCREIGWTPLQDLGRPSTTVRRPSPILSHHDRSSRHCTSAACFSGRVHVPGGDSSYFRVKQECQRCPDDLRPRESFQGGVKRCVGCLGFLLPKIKMKDVVSQQN